MTKKKQLSELRRQCCPLIQIATKEAPNKVLDYTKKIAEAKYAESQGDIDKSIEIYKYLLNETKRLLQVKAKAVYSILDKIKGLN